MCSGGPSVPPLVGARRWAQGGERGSVRSASPATVPGRAPLRHPAEWMTVGVPGTARSGRGRRCGPPVRSACAPDLTIRQAHHMRRRRREARPCECCDDAKPYPRPSVRRGGGPGPGRGAGDGGTRERG
ncbi:hypothetical protein CRV15_11930 [Streptomyces clavuligerus]|uniref:Uncharacterized protein n=1 Tax=Streptomyces clavuligerus TaxID=1901 RepID=B5H3X1_STRCL|nr:hypothetical protein D1794_12495 [Streptomyces clavuligerus]EDY53266.1 hypothetical protein SSCG_06295 [Streptomyces clavuligerus]EFG08381.1 Hypothetical protein SCLAV_3310 [Streptomyces clavuligerus]QCS06273.1 hypothetical protein CRV15_11930 [Streptomyces clavuligerus]QPJ94372.1 hypothetical protein GE265_16050 [Streptomyces clavuligerus]